MDFIFSAESLLAPSMDPDEEGVVAMVIPGAAGHAPTLQSEAVTNELQELSLHPAPKLLPLRDRKNGECNKLKRLIVKLLSAMAGESVPWCAIDSGMAGESVPWCAIDSAMAGESVPWCAIDSAMAGESVPWCAIDSAMAGESVPWCAIDSAMAGESVPWCAIDSAMAGESVPWCAIDSAMAGESVPWCAIDSAMAGESVPWCAIDSAMAGESVPWCAIDSAMAGESVPWCAIDSAMAGESVPWCAIDSAMAGESVPWCAIDSAMAGESVPCCAIDSAIAGESVPCCAIDSAIAGESVPCCAIDSAIAGESVPCCAIDSAIAGESVPCCAIDSAIAGESVPCCAIDSAIAGESVPCCAIDSAIAGESVPCCAIDSAIAGESVPCCAIDSAIAGESVPCCAIDSAIAGESVPCCAIDSAIAGESVPCCAIDSAIAGESVPCCAIDSAIAGESVPCCAIDSAIAGESVPCCAIDSAIAGESVPCCAIDSAIAGESVPCCAIDSAIAGESVPCCAIDSAIAGESVPCCAIDSAIAGESVPCCAIDSAIAGESVPCCAIAVYNFMKLSALKSPAAFHEQRKSLERARSCCVAETSAEPSLQAKQLKLKRARLADDLNEKIAQRPGPIELIEKNILPVDSNLKEAIIDGQGGSFAAESSSFDEDSSDALSPEQPASQESQGSQSSQNSQSSHCSAPSPPESKFRDLHQPSQCSPPTQAPPPADFLKAPPPAEPAPPLKLTNGMTALPVSKPAPTLIKQSQPKSLSDKSSQRKKSKDSKPKVKKLKYHQYIPPDQKQERELPPAMDSSYAKVAELKHELKLRSLPVSGTKIDLIERLRVYQDHRNSQAQVAPGNGSHSNGSHINCPTTVLHRPGEGGVVLATFPLVATVPGPGGGPSAMATPTVMQFGSTSSTPPGSPAPSERSTMGGSADEASCNGDAFGEAMSSPPMHLIKEEHCSTASPCRFSQHALQQPQQPITDGRAFDKDQMLQEKDKQIEELTRMLRQKQKLVETLRSQLEQGKSPPSPSNLDPSIQRVLIKQEPGEPSSQGQQGPLWPPEEFSEVTVKEEPESEMAEEVPVQQVSPAPHVFLNQPTPSLAPPSFPLDILKTPLSPTLLTDSNGNHFLLALTNHSTDAQRSDTAKQAGRITLQRLQSSPTKLPSQSPPQLLTTSAQSKQQQQPDLTNQPIQKASPQSQSPSKVCPILDQHALFSPSPSPPGRRSKGPPQYQEALKQNPDRESAPCSQQMDDLFDILIENGEISADFKGDTDPPSAPLTRLRPNTPPLPPCPDLALTLAPSLSHSPPLLLAQDPGDSSTGSAVALAGSGRLEDFLESTTGAPLLRADAEGCGQRLSLIDDLHNEMLSTASILDQPLPSPMDTSELHFPVAPGDPAAGPPPSSGHLGNLGLDLADPCLDSMDWLDLTMGMGLCLNSGLPSLNTQTPSSVFSADFLDSHDLQLHWDSCL
ncbi:UNVERIFIED_CONTAM: hypothetical protein FKN15_054332 [Acipenser sinensis]